MYSYNFSSDGVLLNPEILASVREIFTKYYVLLLESQGEPESMEIPDGISESDETGEQELLDSIPTIEPADDVEEPVKLLFSSLEVSYDDGRSYSYDNPWEAEANLERLRGASGSNVEIREWVMQGSFTLKLHQSGSHLYCMVEAPDGISESFVPELKEYLLSTISDEEREKQKPLVKVFIGHGGNNHWEAVRDYIADAGVEVEAFEESDRVGRSTYEEVINMIRTSAVAVIIMNKADEMANGSFRARQNVIHELGLSQAFLGAPNVIILKEDGVEIPTNLGGLTYVPYETGSIYSTKKEVLTLISNRSMDYNSHAFSGYGYYGR